MRLSHWQGKASEAGCVFEALEGRLLLDGAAPVLLTPLEDYYTLGEGALTLGIDGYDADGDDLSITVETSNPVLKAFVPAGNHYARLHFVTSDGAVDIGDILVQLFDGRAPQATQRFITLARNEVLPDGTLDPAGTPFYTDVVVHRVIPEFMIQTGDAVNGDGTGGSPLGTFPDVFDPDLNFALPGVLAMANSGPDTNDCQFFITAAPTRWLDQKHVIFGQMISGQEVYDAIINLPTDDNDRPIDPPLLQYVEILDDSPQDGTITFTADDGFAGEVQVTITLDDGHGNQATHEMTVLVLGDPPEIEDPGDVYMTSGTKTLLVPATDDGGLDIETSISSSYADATVSWDPDTFEVQIDVPASYSGIFTVTLEAVEAGQEGRTPATRTFYVISQRRGDPPVEAHLPLAADGTMLGTTFAGGRLYVAAGAAGLEVYAMTYSPELLGTYRTPEPARAVEVVGDVAFVATTRGGLLALNVADPADIQPIGSLPLGGIAVTLAVQGTTALVPLYNGGIASVDITDPGNMVLRHTLTRIAKGLKFAGAVDVVLKGKYAFVSDANLGGVIVLSVSKSKKLKVVSAFGTGGSPWGLDIGGNVLFVADQAAGLIAFDVSNPKKPRYLGRRSMNDVPWQVTVFNQTAVLSNNRGGFSFVDVSDPQAMGVEYSLQTPSAGAAGDLDGPLLALPVTNDGVVIMDVTSFLHRLIIHDKMSFRDEQGVLVTVVARNAKVEVHTGAPGGGRIERLVARANSPKSAVTITTRGGHTRVEHIRVAGQLGSFSASTTDLLGDMIVDRGLSKLMLGDVSGEHVIDIGAPLKPKAAMSVTLGRVTDLSIGTETPVKCLKVVDWRDTGGASDQIRAPWIGRILAAGGKNGPAGHFQADLLLTGTGNKKPALANARIAGDLTDVRWDITGRVGKIVVLGRVVDSTVRATQFIAALALGAVEGSDFLVGIADGVARHAGSADDFADAGVIKNVRITGLKDAPGVTRFFADSNFSAATIGSVALLNADFDNENVAFGLFALSAGTGREIKSVKYLDTITGEKWRYPPRKGQVFVAPGDLVIEVI